MSNIILAWPNHTGDGTLSSPDAWESTLPLVNLQSRIFSDVAQTAVLTPSITATFTDFKSIGTVALAAHNLSETATIRIRFYSDAAKTTLLLDSGFVAVWPRVFDSLQLPWEANNFWLGTPSYADTKIFTQLFTYHADRNYFIKCVQIDITDSSNPDSYIEAGRLFLAATFEPQYNPPYGKLDMQYAVNTEIVEALDDESTEYAHIRRPKRIVNIGFDYLTKNEGIMRILDMQRSQGIDKEILYAESREYDQFSNATTFLGRLVSLDKLSIPDVSLYSATINIKEIL